MLWRESISETKIAYVHVRLSIKGGLISWAASNRTNTVSNLQTQHVFTSQSYSCIAKRNGRPTEMVIIRATNFDLKA